MTKAINAVYLDQPELLVFKGVESYKYQLGYIEYNNYYSFSKTKSYLSTKRIERIMEDIRRDTKNMNEKEKILYVYNYVASHNYDKLFTYSKYRNKIIFSANYQPYV